MPKRPLRVVVVAEESAGVQVLHGLVALRPAPEIAAVITSADASELRPLVYEAARSLGLTIWPPQLLRSAELAERLQHAAIDVLLNVHSLHVLPADVVATPRIGSFNLHPGPLPEYAGLNVPSWAIYNGEESHAVSLHWMDEGIDTGPVAWMSRFELGDKDTGLSVTAKCVRQGVPLVLKLVQLAERDASSIPRREQDLSRRRYFPAGPPQNGRLDWAARATEILRFVRAADYAPFRSPWGHPWGALGGHRVGIAKAARTGVAATEPPGTVEDVTHAGAFVATGDELILVQRVSFGGRSVKPTELFAD